VADHSWNSSERTISLVGPGIQPASADARSELEERSKDAGTDNETGIDHLRVIRSDGQVTTVTDLNSEIRLDAPAEETVERIQLTSPPIVAPGGVRVRYRAIGLVLAGSDVLCLAMALLLSQILTVGLAGRLPTPLPIVAAISVLWVIIFHGFGLYTPQHLSPHEMFRRVISATSVGMVLSVVVTFGSQPAVSRAWMGLTWFLAIVLELTTRRLWNWWIFTMKTDGRLAYRTLVVGDNPEAARLHQALGDPGLGYSPLGHVVVNGNHSAPKGRVVGELSELGAIIQDHGVECLFVASTAVDLEQMALINSVARRTGVEIRISANLPETLSSRLNVNPVGGLMAISLRPVHLTGTQATIKRTFDILISAVVLVLTLPLLAIIALAVKMTSNGPILFTQDRITSGGRTFRMFKFRTMLDGANQLLDEDDVDRSEAFFKSTAAITPVGRWLRRLSLDELPQLWNIFKGEMSLVGPRPLPAEQVVANLELLEPRHEVRAGLTGWWQINGRSDLNPVNSVRMDLFYIENWSLTLDLYILLKTIGAVVIRRGAY
jgi:exopolysaccharide biosynthesis polyprenyl glycosylphosphotransferase